MKEKVIAVLKDFTEMDLDDIGENADLMADLGLSSLDVVDAVVAFEDAFDVEIPDRVIVEMRTVGDVVRYLEGRG